MTWSRFACFSGGVVALLVLVPFTASAQGIAGSVADDTGGVLPGVTVEASSPALIEGIRTAFTDGQGLYNITNLAPGTYSVTFTLPGFSTIIREGVVLTAGFTGQYRRGHASRRYRRDDHRHRGEPAGGRAGHRGAVLGVDRAAQVAADRRGLCGAIAHHARPWGHRHRDVGGSSGIYRSNGQSGGLFFHGKSDVSVQYDGMGTASPSGTSIPYVLNPEFASETVMETGGGNAESEATLVMNLVPQEGANQFSFKAAGTYTNDTLQSDNLTQELKDRGVTHTNEMLKFYNTDVAVGGPFKQDKVWFFAAVRAARNINTVPGVFFNAGQGTPFYVPDLDRPAYRTEWMRSGGGRVTVQANEKNKLGFFTDFQTFFNRGRGEFASPEAYSRTYNLSPQALYQATWTSPISNRILLDGGFSHMRGRWPYPAPGDAEFASVPGAISTTEATTNLRYGARGSYTNVTDQYRYSQRAAVSYVTGSHAVKAGFLMEQGQTNADREVSAVWCLTSGTACPIGLDSMRRIRTRRSRKTAASPWRSTSRISGPCHACRSTTGSGSTVSPVTSPPRVWPPASSSRFGATSRQ